ncbi:protein KTI12 [Kluyveromyces marxianus]|uniref:Protein KTI12 n=1 Tax=Kluyveromyces marxianus (strain DMKU3-1042 / BCC 29191 / NBRC 104275) TaxID=1003335 RepID=W0TA14_KLUMD|nr:protein KTI12 [Kluyveromyces marxianus DMKU3-1042]BAO39863.1 protein KTI12 [Kluyveromyces marxianus DMKU3-1042]BAP71346.1 protein KTI12 [Kluyveromyces marxianus]
MPLVLLTGFPSSGKTTVAKKIVSLIQQTIDSNEKLSNYSVVYHSDETLNISHDDYIGSNEERRARSKIMSVVKRDLSRQKVVVVDSLNYIKGFRYQLHCEVKNVMTTYCLIHTACPITTLVEWNSKETETHTPWEPEFLNALIQRYEEPNPQTRWDSPLFTILTPQDDVSAIYEDISKALFPTVFKSKTDDRDAEKILQQLKPNNATILKAASHTNSLQILDSETSAVVKSIMEYMQHNVVSGGISRIILTPDHSDIDDPACLYVDVSLQNCTMPQLQRIRRQFVAMNRLRNLEADRVKPLFVEYLNKNLNI